MPVLIVANSDGDWATGITFPIFRSVTTLFEDTQGDLQDSVNLKTVGWSERYRTHWLSRSQDADPCGLSWEEKDLGKTLEAETKWWFKERRNFFRSFNSKTLPLCNQLVLRKTPDTDDQRLRRPDFMPLWVVQTDTDISEEHNDYVNRHLADFIRQVYYTILRERDAEMVEYLR